MDKIVELFNLLQITRAQPQYGYAVSGGNARIGNLAEHHYLVTMIAWQIAELAMAKGAKVDLCKLFKFCLLHDIGELFGGDIGMYYAKANPRARTLAKQFEQENQNFLSNYFTNQAEMRALAKEALNSSSDECHIAKVADFLEFNHYKLFNGQLQKKDIELIIPRLIDKIGKIDNKITRKILTDFIRVWKKKMLAYDSFLDSSTDALNV